MSSRWIAGCLAVALSGCGSIIGLGGDRELRVSSTPDGARLLVDGRTGDQTAPCVVLLDPAEEHRIDGRLDDMRGGTQIHRSTRVGVVIADIVFTAGLGLWIDYLTGAMYRFPDAVMLHVGRTHMPEPGADEFPPAPHLMPATDPYAPAMTSRTTNVLDAGRACAVCEEPFGRGDTCQSCGVTR
jgi:hypothetical protein